MVKFNDQLLQLEEQQVGPHSHKINPVHEFGATACSQHALPHHTARIGGGIGELGAHALVFVGGPSHGYLGVFPEPHNHTCGSNFCRRMYCMISAPTHILKHAIGPVMLARDETPMA